MSDTRVRVRSALRLAAMLLVAGLGAGCGGGSSTRGPASLPDGIAELSCDELFVRGEELVARKKSGAGRQYLRRYEQRCAREPRIEQAKLKICESFLQESAPEQKAEGVAVCRQIITFYPNHPVSCAAQFQIADYHFELMRSCERDQSETVHAVEEFQKLIATYPDCDQVVAAQEKLGLAYARLACAELKVAQYYQRVNEPKAAQHRLEDLLRKFPAFPERCEASRMLIKLQAQAGELDAARTQFARMREDCAAGEDLDEARRYIGVAPTIE